ncbi:unnamed protein product [Protopolystoma xenopodis]|uniref:Uncharacterized protein n=1 Tax=Protopolystoma xenopodis TaxID=117903 RepID=A0A448WCZ4_9PLAT|nr:unnamed protein product [Protopolystoma xenopodis]
MLQEQLLSFPNGFSIESPYILYMEPASSSIDLSSGIARVLWDTIVLATFFHSVTYCPSTKVSEHNVPMSFMLKPNAFRLVALSPSRIM